MKKTKLGNKILSTLLVLCMALGMLQLGSTTAHAADTEYSMALGVNGVKSRSLDSSKNAQDAVVYEGDEIVLGNYVGTNISWVRLNAEGLMFSSANIRESLFSTVGSRAYPDSTLNYAMAHYHGSALNLSSTELVVVSETTLSADSMYDVSTGHDSQRFFPLSQDEYFSYLGTNSTLAKDTTGSWWLRNGRAVSGTDGGTIVVDTSSNLGSRPAFKLDLNTVLFTSASSGSKADELGSFEELGTSSAPTSWKLTVKDADRGFSLREEPTLTLSDRSVSFTYDGAKTGENEYISVMLVDDSNNITHYAKIVDLASASASGSASFVLPSSFNEGDTVNIKIFNEQINGDNKTDFSSAFVEKQLSLVLPTVEAPTFTPNGGSFDSTQNVEIASATVDADIYYTTDNTTPTTASTPYSGAITLNETTTVKAIAVKSGMTNSSVSTADFTKNVIIQAVEAPTFTPNGGSFDSTQNVEIASATVDADIYYTTDNTTPTTASTPYSGAITLNETTTLKAIAVKTGMANSSVSTVDFTKSAASSTSLVAFGDSIPAGYKLADMDNENFVALINASGYATTKNHGISGLTSIQLKEKMVDDHEYDADIASADYITLTIGGNDIMEVFYTLVANKYNSTSSITTPYLPVDEVADALANSSDPRSFNTMLTAIGIIGDGYYTYEAEFEAKYALVKANVQSMIDYIRGKNSDVEIVVTNQYNPYKGIIIFLTNVGAFFDAGLSSEGGFNETLSTLSDCTLIDIYTEFENANETPSTVTNATAADLDFHPNAEGHKIYANMLINTLFGNYTITLDVNGGFEISPTAIKTNPQGKLDALPTPIRSNHSFDGWYTALTGGTKIDTNHTFDQNVTIYARWIQDAVEAPTFTPDGGKFTTDQIVEIASLTSKASIYYTTNGTEPTLSSTLYNGPITVSETTTIKAIAIKNDMLDSAVSSATFEKVPSYLVEVTNGVGGGNYAEDADITITANAAPAGQQFKDWTLTGVTVSDNTQNQLTFKMPSNAVAATANYEDITTSVILTPTNVVLQKGESQQFSASIVGEGNPSQAVVWQVSGNNDNATQIDNNGLLTISATETAISIAVTAVSAANKEVFAIATVTVSDFALTKHTITPSAGANGSISPDSAYDISEGANVTFVFTPNAGYEVDKVLVNGLEVTPTSPTTHTLTNITENTAIEVTFKLIQPKLIQGAHQRITIGSEAVFISDALFENYIRTEVNDKEEHNSTTGNNNKVVVEDGSTKVTLSAAFIKELGVGEHRIEIESSNGIVETGFYVLEVNSPPSHDEDEGNVQADIPDTRDYSAMWLYLIMSLCSLVAIGFIVYKKRKLV